MIRWYRNSFLASLVSIIGCLGILGGIMTIVDGDVGAGILVIVLGLALAILGKVISDNKAFKTWWKQVEDKGLEDQIARSTQIAIQIYNKNPQARTLKKIAQLNPTAASDIQSQIDAKKKK